MMTGLCRATSQGRTGYVYNCAHAFLTRIEKEGKIIIPTRAISFERCISKHTITQTTFLSYNHNNTKMNAPLRSQQSSGFTLKRTNNIDAWREKLPDMMNVDHDTPKYMNAPSSNLTKSSKLAFAFGEKQPMKQQEWSLSKSPTVQRAPIPTAKQLISNTRKLKSSPVDERLIRRGMVQLM